MSKCTYCKYCRIQADADDGMGVLSTFRVKEECINDENPNDENCGYVEDKPWVFCKVGETK